ncbi:MAG: hypothetical protein EBX37_14870, partial [Alphaproteobacteria bacterium]|nr:hypothetical protein [Alphaproteobacteria bacterium]
TVYFTVCITVCIRNCFIGINQFFFGIPLNNVALEVENRFRYVVLILVWYQVNQMRVTHKHMITYIQVLKDVSVAFRFMNPILLNEPGTIVDIIQ